MADKIGKNLKSYKTELIKRGITEEKADALVSKAKEYYSEYMNDDIPPAEMMHAESVYLKSAVYKALLPELGAQASFDFIAKILYDHCYKMGKWCDKITRIPGFKYLFIMLFERMTDKLFGDDADFRKEIFVSDKSEFRFNMTQCPYVKYFKRTGFPELCEMCCVADEYSYGHMKKVSFERTKTLGTGGECCDFCFKVK